MNVNLLLFGCCCRPYLRNFNFGVAHSLPSLFFTFLGLTPDNRPTGVFALLGPAIRLQPLPGPTGGDRPAEAASTTPVTYLSSLLPFLLLSFNFDFGKVAESACSRLPNQ